MAQAAIGFISAVLVAGCAHGSAKTPPIAETAVGAYLGNPAPYLVASLATCTFEGAVSSDLRPTTAGPIVAHCRPRGVFRWNAVVVDGVMIEGPPAIQLATSARTSYAYRAMYTATGKPVSGDARFTWSLGPGCDGIAELDNVGDMTFVVPKATGRCTLRVTEPQGHVAERSIAVE